MNYKLHYAPLDLQGKDIEVHEFETKLDLSLFVRSKVLPAKLHSDKVFLAAFPDGEIIVSENEFFIDELFESESTSLNKFITGIEQKDSQTIYFDQDFYLQEYASYEEAYKSALEMKEESPLCYS